MDKNKSPKLPSPSSKKTFFPKKSDSEWKSLISIYLDDPQSLTIKQFCKKHNISKSSFYKWRCKLYPDSFTKAAGKFITVRQIKESEKFIAGVIPAPSISSPLKISLGQISLEFTCGCELSELSQIISLLNAA